MNGVMHLYRTGSDNAVRGCRPSILYRLLSRFVTNVKYVSPIMGTRRPPKDLRRCGVRRDSQRSDLRDSDVSVSAMTLAVCVRAVPSCVVALSGPALPQGAAICEVQSFYPETVSHLCRQRKAFPILESANDLIL